MNAVVATLLLAAVLGWLLQRVLRLPVTAGDDAGQEAQEERPLRTEKERRKEARRRAQAAQRERWREQAESDAAYWEERRRKRDAMELQDKEEESDSDVDVEGIQLEDAGEAHEETTESKDTRVSAFLASHPVTTVHRIADSLLQRHGDVPLSDIVALVETLGHLVTADGTVVALTDVTARTLMEKLENKGRFTVEDLVQAVQEVGLTPC